MPSGRQTGMIPPAVDTCHWPAGRPRGRASLAGRDKRPHVDLVPPRFVRLVGHPPAVRRERAPRLAERGLQDHPRRAIAHHRHDPEVGVRLRADAVIQQEPTVRRPVVGHLALVGGHEPLLRARAARELLIEVILPRPARLEHDPGAVGRPDGKPSSAASNVNRLARAPSSSQRSMLPCTVRDTATRRPSGDTLGSAERCVRRADGAQRLARPVHPGQLPPAARARPVRHQTLSPPPETAS